VPIARRNGWTFARSGTPSTCYSCHLEDFNFTRKAPPLAAKSLFKIVLTLAVLICGARQSTAQNASAVPRALPAASMADSLQRAGHTQLHIFYVHGIGANGPDHDSYALRVSICKRLHCTTNAGELEKTDYADKSGFDPAAMPPTLTYLGDRIWMDDQEWKASAPYVDHWKLVTPKGWAVYVDEINWWPLVFALKCRQMVKNDAALVGPNVPYIDLCSESTRDPNDPQRYRLYPWLTSEEAKALKALPRRAALINRTVKNNLLDWGFSDALIAVGNLQPLLLEGIRELVLQSVAVAPDGSRNASLQPQPNQEFVIVTHSLGSYLIFSALDPVPAASVNNEIRNWRSQFDHVLSHTTIVYFFANQLRLLELANLDVKTHLRSWSKLRHDYLASQTDLTRSDAPVAKIVAWSDPSDLLTWTVPDLEHDTGYRIEVENHLVRNAIDWFWLFEGPKGAHDNYASNGKVIRTMLKPSKPDRKQ
jgi:hypothetical protein